MLAFFNTQTLALLAVAVGFIVLCLGLWHLWTNHAQLRTEVQLLRSQQQTGTGSDSYQALETKCAASSSPVPDAGAADITALMRGDTGASASPDVRVCRMPGTSATAHVVHRTESAGDALNTNDDEGSETSGSEYDDDDEDVTDEDEEANEAGNVVTADTPTDVTALTGTADDAQPPVDLVESLLSSMVTNAIDGAVERQGGATAIMSCVDVSVEGANEVNETVTDVSVAVEDVTEEVAAVNTEAGIESTAGGTDDDAAEAALDAGATAFADELRQHTVVQLKTICQEHQVGVRRADGSSKRKDELVADLVVALYEGGDNDAQDTASNESANAVQ